MKAQAKKNQNPLYVVKEDHVEEASGLFDLFIKKFNLVAVVNIFEALFKTILENIQTYAAFKAVSDFFDLLVDKLKLFKQFSII